ncbi:MAG: IS110 family transposase, partial [Bacteroidales bacterium]|nr:IS110 family transposase [Bacteroidales bacterium]
NQSGKHVGKTKISKKGNAHIRRILHMPALNVVNFVDSLPGVYDKFHIFMRFRKTGLLHRGSYL